MDPIETLAELTARVDAAGETTVLTVFARDDAERVSGTTLAWQARNWHAALVARGIRAGDRVALFAPADSAWIAAALGTLEAGAVLTPLDAQLAGEQLAHVLGDAAPAVVLCDATRVERIVALALAQAPPLARLDEAPDDATPPDAAPPAGDADAVLFYTSGTTGPPKGVPLSHAKLCWQIERIGALGIVGPDDRVLLPLPLHHVYPVVVGLLVPLARGVPIVLPYALTGPQVRRALAAGGVTVVVGVPRLYAALVTAVEQALAAHGRLAGAAGKAVLATLTALRRRTGLRLPRALLAPVLRRLGGELRLLASGGAALDPALAWRLEALGLDVATGYGLTETAPLLTINAPGAARFDTAGCALPGVELRRIDGEIQARGPAVFDGYRNLPEKTAEAFDGAWFRTGDLGWVDEDGYLHLEGRRSTRIVTSSGETLQPDLVEQAYERHPMLQEAAVLPRDDRLVMIAVPAAAALRDEEHAEDPAAAVRAAVREQGRTLPSHQRVTQVAVTREPLPRTRLGKLRRHLLEERFEQALEEPRDGTAGDRAALAAPLAIDEMQDEDRELLEDPAARAAWDELAERFPDRGLAPGAWLAGDLGIDSLAWLDLGLAIERRTGVELDEATITRVETVRDLLHEVAGATRGSAVADPLADPETVLNASQRRWLEPLSPRERRLARLLLPVDRLLMRLLTRCRAEGLEHLPTQAPYVLAPNHRSYLDAFVLLAVLPAHVIEVTHFAGWTGAAFGNPLTRQGSRLAQAVPIDPARHPRSSLALGAAVLARGRALAWFPEGRRSPTGTLQAFRPGLGRILAHQPVMVVPVWIEGTQHVLPPGRRWPRRCPVTVHFGVPVSTDELREAGRGSDDGERIVDALHARVAALAPADA
ncbi:MAG: AMP-binding protein [Gammaproteobacteria bacterium]